jgi:transposase-like protein
MIAADKQAAMAARREKWRGIISGAEASGLSLRAYCKQQEVDLSQFYYWRRVLQAEGRQAAPKASPGAFVLVQAPGQSEAPGPAADQTPVLELLLDCGWRLRIPRNVDEALLATTLRLLATR